MNQFAKYSGNEPSGAQTVEPTDLERLVHDLHNDFIGVAQSVSDLKQEVEELKQRQAPTAMTIDQPTPIEQEPEILEQVIADEEQLEVPAQQEPTDNVLGMSDADIQALLEQAAQEPLQSDDADEQVPEVFREKPADTQYIIENPSFEISPEAVKAVPATLAIGALAMPASIEDSVLVCKVVEPFDYAALDLISEHTEFKVSPEAAPIGEVVSALRIHYGPDGYDSEREAVAEVASTSRKNWFNRRAA